MKFFRIRNNEIVGEIEMIPGKDITVLPAFDGTNTEELVRADRLESTLLTALSAKDSREVFAKFGVVDKR